MEQPRRRTADFTAVRRLVREKNPVLSQVKPRDATVYLNKPLTITVTLFSRLIVPGNEA